MCGRYTITVSLEELMLRYWIGETTVPFHKPKYNVAPGQMIMAIISDGEKNKLGELKWGLVPSWADDPKISNKMLNARSETVWDKPAFKQLIRRKRCIIPADGFYEWRKDEVGKQPMRITLRDRSLFSMAGLYDTWLTPEGHKLSTCTILTTEPNELMLPIHNRMPVILSQENETIWLDRSLQDQQHLNALLKPFPAQLLEAYPVAAAVGNVANDNAACIEPIRLDN
ncbi:putative SOS response-associated peptidase YoqW [Paenibacillus baekrokdamisoli]|uniref:Abasic site processing protein n=1 Tax=Paenibacillus baekrokdamisoli TaxID=1712516 RepID=A0A3G9IL89_9BACL|nr:SOS response-associated peptidase [Paenibacillus baekrokdamisoli]BBH19660.1 putative SOS response-associated peptidase YoqW [Paenibacillus baekrokdamisoli]